MPQVLKWVEEAIQASKVHLLSSDHEEGGEHTWAVPFDPSLEEVTISLSGPAPRIQVQDPAGRRAGQEKGWEVMLCLLERASRRLQAWGSPNPLLKTSSKELQSPPEAPRGPALLPSWLCSGFRRVFSVLRLSCVLGSAPQGAPRREPGEGCWLPTPEVHLPLQERSWRKAEV